MNDIVLALQWGKRLEAGFGLSTSPTAELRFEDFIERLKGIALPAQSRDLVAETIGVVLRQGDPEAAKRWVHLLGPMLQDSDRDVIVAAAQAIETIGESHHGIMPDHLPLLLSGLSPALEPILFQIAEAGVVKLLGLGRQEKAHACVQALLSSLGQSEDADMRAACIASLAWLLTLLQQHAVTIAAGLDDPEEVVRLATTAAINRVHGQQPGVALDIYLGRFNHAQAHTRISAVRAASGLVKGHPGLLASLLPHLLEVVGKDETDVSQCAMEAVSNVMTSIEADRLLMDITSGQSHHRLVTLSARLLFKHQELTAAYHSRFLAWLGDGDADVRLAAVRSLKSVNGNEGRDESIRGLLLRLQQDTDSRVQMAALDALSVYLSAETLSTALLQLLGPGHGVLHNLQVIRKTVARWPLQGQVTEGGGRDAWVSALRELLEDVDEGVRGAAAEALGYLVAKSTGEVILNLLAPVLRHAQPYVREAGLNVITAAHATDSASARERLKLIVPLLEATEATVRAAAIRAARRMLPFLDEPLIGRTGGRYHLVHPAGQLGQGYFGSVHAALDPASMRCVAIKLYSEADRAVRDHFIEASMLDRIRQLGHRHVIRLFDELRGPNNTVTGLVLYPLCAETLQQRLQRPLDMATAVRYLSQLSSGAAALASVNLAHRDLTLRNVLITFDDSIRIGDFGTAVLPDSQTWMGLSNIATGAFSRTLAPEVQAGDDLHDEIKADAWALGACIFFVLTRQHDTSSSIRHDRYLEHIAAASQVPAVLRAAIEADAQREGLGWGGLDTEDMQDRLLTAVAGLLTVDPAERMSAADAAALLASLPGAEDGVGGGDGEEGEGEEEYVYSDDEGEAEVAQT